MPFVPSWSLSFVEADVAWLQISTPGRSVNLLTHAALDELAAILDQLAARDELAGLILGSGKPGTFIAGADLQALAASLAIPQAEVVQRSRRGQAVLGRLAELPLVTVAAVDGVCLGGGAELACWCDRRVLTNAARTEFGFPEVQFGLIPGWGGTVRFPRLVGLGKAAELIATGGSLDAEQAAAWGLADDVVPPDRLLAAACAQVREARTDARYLDDRRRRGGPLPLDADERRFVRETVRDEVQRRLLLHHTAPYAVIEVLVEAATQTAAQAAAVESAAIARLYGTPEHAGLLNVFFLAERNKTQAVVPASASPVRSVGVIGAGIMGTGIAVASVRHEVPVVIADASPPALQKGFRRIADEVAYNKRLAGPDPVQAARLAPYLTQATDVEQAAACDLVIECVVENADVKRRIFQRVEPKLAPQAVLASNTSTIPVARLAAVLQRPERCCGLHFFNPVRQMKLVEVVRGERTNDETVARVVAYVRHIGRMPIVVRDGPGFLVNRLLTAYLNEALLLLSEGAGIVEIDQAAVAFGMPLGPLALCDLIGLDTVLYAGRGMWEAFPDRIIVTPVLPVMCRRGRLGRKRERGFFRYRSLTDPPEPDPEIGMLLAPYIRRQRAYTPEEITRRLFLPVLIEATRVLEGGVVGDPRDVDLGLVFGLGFPSFRGGLLFWADTLGAEAIIEQLRPWEHLGVRYQPTAMLLDMARERRKFYPEGFPAVGP